MLKGSALCDVRVDLFDEGIILEFIFKFLFLFSEFIVVWSEFL